MNKLKMYACFDPKGEIMANTIRIDQYKSLTRALEETFNVYEWKFIEQGYTCSQVEVTIKKI